MSVLFTFSDGLAAECKFQAWESMRARCPIDYLSFLATFDYCRFWPVVENGRCVGALVGDGPEVHVCINSGFGLWFDKSVLSWMQAHLMAYGFLQTVATTEIGKNFVNRLGFVKVGSRNGNDVMRLYGH